ncbi:MAG: RNase H-like domain-containing protein, partial [Candidatus Thiodiazotropha sp.]
RKDTLLQTDASRYGLGSALYQKQDNGDFKPVSYASRALSPTEQRYSTIEKEALGVVFGCEKHRDFLIGKTFHIETDHKPLVSLLGHKDLNDLPLRIQRFRMRLMPFSYTISHEAGKNLIIPDLLSRHPISRSLSHEEQQNSIETENYVDLIVRNLPATDMRLQEIRMKQGQDIICQTLFKYCQDGWPESKHKACEIGKIYWPYRGEITVNEGLLMKADRLIIPTEMKQEILSKIHGAHQGITKCKLRAKESVWWLGINSDIEKLVKSCDVCAKLQNDHSEPMISTEYDDRPWKHLGSDLFFWRGHNYLLVICYYSRFIELAKLSTSTSEEVIKHMKSIFSRHGVCDILTTDNGPCYASKEFKDFTSDYGIQHKTSSSRYPQGNAMAERGVQTCKRLLEKSDDPYIALMNYRATPLSNGYSPSELLFGRKIKTTLPQIPEKLKPVAINQSELQQKERVAREYSKRNYDVRKRARTMVPLNEGDCVFVKNFNTEGKVVRQADRPRSYVIETPRGVISRNRRHIVKLSKNVEVSEPSDLTSSAETQNSEMPINQPDCYDNKESDTPSSQEMQSSRENSDNVYVTRSGRISKPPERLTF